MAQHKAPESVLVATARALDRELEDFATHVEHIRRAPLTTERQIARAREMVLAVAPARAAIHARVAALERAVAAADTRRAEQAAALEQRLPHVDLRAAELQRLLDLYIGLGLRATMEQATHAHAGDDEALVAIASDTDALLHAARRGDFPDIVRLAETLARQLAATLDGRRRAFQPE